MSFVHLKNIEIAYGRDLIFKNLNLQLNKGEIYAIIGPSGCGKSTLVKTIGGIIKAQSGEIIINNKPLNPKKHSIGYIPQNYGLLNWLKIKNNILVGAKIRKNTPSNFDYIVDKLEIRDLLDRYPGSLSGGQQQRIALARAFLLNPDVLLMDEPFSALDTFTAQSSKELFLQLWKEQKITSVIVTHNIREAVQLGKHIIILSGKPAEIIHIIPNPLYEKGASRNDMDFFLMEKKIEEEVNNIKEKNNV